MLLFLALACAPSTDAEDTGKGFDSGDSGETVDSGAAGDSGDSGETGDTAPCADGSEGELYYVDADGDGWGDATQEVVLCDAPPDGLSATAGDCDDTDAAVNPAATEGCDGRDDDCDGIPDDGAVADAWYADADADGYGDPATLSTACPPAEGGVDNAEDCDDGSDEVHPGAIDACDDGVDADCDGVDRTCELYGNVHTADATIFLTRGGAGQVGSGVEVVPDVDGDGDDELLLGIVGYSDRVSRGGAVLLLPGAPVSGDPVGQELGGFYGDTASQAAGYAFGAVGDLDGDGVRDLVACSSNAGAVWLVGGLADTEATPSDAWATATATGASYFGRWCGNAGDVTGDGVDDIATTALYSSARTPSFYFFDGATFTGDVDAGDAVFTVNGTSIYDGVSRAGPVGDLDGDGVDDLVVGLATLQGSVYGGAMLLLGGGSGALTEADADATYLAEPSTSMSGELVAAGGDLDGDGLADLAVAAHTSGRNGGYSGSVYLVSGTHRGDVNLASAEAIVTGETGDLLGQSVLVKDLDGDGFADVVAGSDQASDGATTGAGAVWVFLGPHAGERYAGGADDSIRGSSSQTRVGTTLAAGNLDGVGRDDLVVGANVYGGGDGAVWIYLVE